MSSVARDFEAAKPMYASHASPKIDAMALQSSPPRGASILRLLLASMPRMVIQMAWTASFTAMRPAMMTEFAARFINIIAPLATLLLSPVVGVISDRCMHKWGRRRPFLVYSSIATAVLLFIMCFKNDMGDSMVSSSILVAFFYLCITIATCWMEMPVNLLVADLAGDRQVTGAALGQGWSILGSILTSCYFKMIPNSSPGAFVAFCIVLMLAVFAAVSYFVAEPPRDPSDDSQVLPERGVIATITGDAYPMPTMLAVYSAVAVIIGFGAATYDNYRFMFFDTRVGNDSDDYFYGRGSSLTDFKYVMIQSVGAYIFTWMLPFLTNKIGANHVITLSLAPQALLIIMAFSRSTTLVGIIDFLVHVVRGMLYVFAVPVVVHVYGKNTDIGARVGLLSSIGAIGQIISPVVGVSITTTDLGFQLPVLVAGIMAVIALVASLVLLKLKLKSR